MPKTVFESNLKLPDTISSRIDVGRLIRELETLNDFFYQNKIRSPGSNVTAPKTTATLGVVSDINKLSLLDENDRAKLIKELKNIKERSPKVHISFAAEPSPDFMKKIVQWLRKNVHNQVLVDVGLQPNIAVGCMLRTTNKVFDLSLKNHFSKDSSVLIEKIRSTK